MPDTSYLAWPFFEDRHRRRAADLERFATSELSALANQAHDDDSVDATCREIVRRLGRTGMLEPCCVTVPDGAFDVRSLCLSRDVLARHEGLADFAFAMQGLGTGPISLFGTAAQRQAYLPPVTRGEKIAAFALSEPQAGSDVGAIVTTAKRDGDGYVINGTKTWISNGGIADHYVVFARTGSEPGAKGLSAFVVDADTPGLTVAARIRTIAPHPLATLAFHNCRIRARALLGVEGEGFKIAMSTLDRSRLAIAAQAVGIAQGAIDAALAYAAERRQFDSRVVDFQAIQFMLADMASQTEAARQLVYVACARVDDDDPNLPYWTSAAKLIAGDTAMRVTTDAVQIFGGYGYISDYPVERMMRDAKITQLYEGTQQVQRLVIARRLLARAGIGR